jgi:tetratricopeptide (TPR) repeat protein
MAVFRYRDVGEVSPGQWLGALAAVGKMEMARAEIALRSGDLDAAAEWASNAIASAVRARRHKDESSSRALLGRVLLAERRAEEAIGEIRTAVAIADELGSPPGRWQSRAALGKALFATGDDDGAAFAYHEAGDIIRSMAATLSLEHGKTFLEALPVQEALKAGS